MQKQNSCSKNERHGELMENNIAFIDNKITTFQHRSFSSSSMVMSVVIIA